MNDVEIQYDVFRYLNAENGARYRRILELFVQAKQRFVLHLKPAELLRELPGIRQDTLELDLQQLTEWGNLRRQSDQTEKRTLEDYRRGHFVYQLSADGEAAERALQVFRENIEAPGELQTLALADIEAGLHELQELIGCEPVDVVKLYSAFQSLFARFEQLVARAEQFIGSVQRMLDLEDLNIQAFLAYKEQLIGYLEQFLQQLVLRIPGIGRLLEELPTERLMEILADMAERDLQDMLQVDDERRAAVHLRWQNRWRGLEGWFLHREGPPQAESLRTCARAAIPDLLSIAAAINDQRSQRSDRAADYRELARWFAESESDADAHRLWREAFGLTPSRHLTIDADTLAEHEDARLPAQTSWLDAPPMRISPQLRATGRAKAAGRSAAMTDHREDLALLRQKLEREAEQMRRARASLATGQRCRLSEFPKLDPKEFDLFLDCLGAVLGRVRSEQTRIEAPSSDGSLMIELELIPDAGTVSLETTVGTLTGPDCWMCIREEGAHVG